MAKKQSWIDAAVERLAIVSDFPSPCCNGGAAIPTSLDGEHWFAICDLCGEAHEIPEPPNFLDREEELGAYL